jgi:hypothetical protein
MQYENLTLRHFLFLFPSPTSPGFGGGRLYSLREPVPPYGEHFDRENEALRPNNTVPWQTNLETTET